MTNPLYRSRGWAVARASVLRRDGRECQIRLPGCTGYASSVDHIVELQDGGLPFAPENLQAACRSCNTAKRNRRVAEKARSSLRQW